MRRALILILLIILATCAPGARKVREVQDRASSMVYSAATNLFWHLWTRALDHEIARHGPTLSISLTIVRQVVESQMKPEHRPAANRRQGGRNPNKETLSCDS